MRFIWVGLMIALCSMLGIGESYQHNLQFNVNLAKSYDRYNGGVSVVPITGTKNVLVEIVDIYFDQPLWSFSDDMYVNNGDISIFIDDATLDWVTLLQEKELIFRVHVLDDIVDIPFEFLPFSMVTEFADRSRYFNDDALISIDYPDARVAIHGATSNAELAVSGSIRADYLVGDGSGLLNLTGPGLNDSYSLNSEHGRHKDVVFVDNDGRVGIHTVTPNARLHVKGNVVFRESLNMRYEDYIVPDGPVLLWDPARGAFRSGIFNERFSSTDLAPYSMGFGEDVMIKSRYSSILAGQSHLIDRYAESSVIIGGQSHSILNNYSVIVGGYKNLVGGEWAVIFGGRENNVYGDYNVVLGGQANEVRGEYNTVIGQYNQVFGDFSVVLGHYHNVSANNVVVLGEGGVVDKAHSFSMLYSDGDTELSTTTSNQMVIQSSRGVGINMPPVVNHMLSVSGNIKANRFIGDGQHLTNIISGQDYWRQTIDEPVGIYYTHGPVSVGTIDSKATLTVSGGINLKDSNQASNGTLRFSDDSGLEFYHDDWISVDQVDTDTQLSPGRGIQLNDRVFSIDRLEALSQDTLYFNGEAWAPKNTQIWDVYAHGIYLPRKWGITPRNEFSSFHSSVMIKSPSGGADTDYPLVVGVTDSLRFSPQDNMIGMNLDYSDASKTAFKMVDSLTIKDSVVRYGGLIHVENNRFKLKQTDRRYKNNDLVTLRTLMSLTPTSMAIHQHNPQTTFDTKGSMSFVHTFMDDHQVQGIGHQARLQESLLTYVQPKHPHYLYLDSRMNLNIMSGTDDVPQPIHFIVGDETRSFFNSDGELIVGPGMARGKLSIFDGGLAFNVNDTSVGGVHKYNQRTHVASTSFNDSSIHMLLNDSRDDRDHSMADFGHLNAAIGTKNSSLISFLVYSDDVPQFDLRSSDRSVVFLENQASTFYLENHDGIFSIIDDMGGDGHTVLTLDHQHHLSLMTPIFSERPTKEVVINADIELSNTDTIRYLNRDRQPVLHALKNQNDFMLRHYSDSPIRFQTEFGDDVLVVSTNRQLAIHSLTPTVDSTLYVNGDVRFNQPIYYQHNADERLVQSFVVDKSTQLSLDTLVPVDTRTDLLEVRSIERIRVDERSGVRLTIDDEDTIKISAPGYYKRQYESYLWDGEDLEPDVLPRFIEAEVKHDIFELKELYPNGGVSISAIDTNDDSEPDAIELYMPLIDGGVIEGDITVNGQLYVLATSADGRYVSSIPFEWQRLENKKLVYYKGNVGIGTLSPDYDLEVSGNMATDILTVSDELIVQRVDFDNLTSTIVDQQLLFSADIDNTTNFEAIQFNSLSGHLLSLVTQGDDEKVGVFTDDPKADIHVKKMGSKATVLLESKVSGKSGMSFFNPNSSVGAFVQVNQASDTNVVGSPKESVIVSSENIYLHVNGSSVPSVYVKPDYVSIGEDNRPNNVFSAQRSVTIGDEFAGRVLNGSQRGLTVQGKLSVGYTAPPIESPTGATFYSKDNLAVGESVAINPDFKGVRVEGRVGVGIKEPSDGLSVFGELKLKERLSFYDDDRNTMLFEFLPQSYSVIPNDRSLDIQVSESLVFNVSGEDRQRAMSIYQNSVTIGSDDSIDDSNLYVFHGENSNVLLDDPSDAPKMMFSVNGDTRHAAIGINKIPGVDTEIAIESNGTTLDSPDIQIRTGKVGVGKVPLHTLDVNGTVKGHFIYKDGNRMYPVPHGVIVMWAGSLSDIPDGWQLCDGTNDTPDLTNKFIKGASLDGMNQSGGKNTGEVTDGAHDHTDGEHGGDNGHAVHGERMFMGLVYIALALLKRREVRRLV